MSSEAPRQPAPTLPAGILVGWIRRPHGIRGEVRVEVESDNPERFDPGAELILRMPNGSCRRLKIVSSRLDKDSLLIGFEGIADRNAVETWRNGRLEIEESALPALPAGRSTFSSWSAASVSTASRPSRQGRRSDRRWRRFDDAGGEGGQVPAHPLRQGPGSRGRRSRPPDRRRAAGRHDRSLFADRPGRSRPSEAL